VHSSKEETSMTIWIKFVDWLVRQYYPEKRDIGCFLFPIVAILFWSYFVLWFFPTSVVKTIYYVLKGEIELPPDTGSYIGFGILTLVMLFMLSIIGYVVWRAI